MTAAGVGHGGNLDVTTRSGMQSGADSEILRVRQLAVVFSPSAQATTTVTLDGGRLGIGRRGFAGLALDDDQISRSHAELVFDPATDRWIVRDLGSRNGTWIDGARAEQAALAHGTVLRIGQTIMVAVDMVVPAGQRLQRDGAVLRGHSLGMQRVRGEIAMAAPSAMPLLVLGESGVGKELVARELHGRSGRSGPFVPVNCATLPRDLAESELFGHVAGAFTGASAARAGLFAEAHGGTLLLDEIGELPEAVQPKLLRALALGEIRPVGSARTTQVDVRVIGATHRDLKGQVAAGAFRADLYARLAGWVLRVPPLRERRDDILELARGVLERQRGEAHTLSCRAAEALLLHDWPFNVRELEHALVSAVVNAEDGVIRCHCLPADISGRVLGRHEPRVRDARGDDLAVTPGAVPTDHELRQLLAIHRGNVLHVARALGKDRQQVYRWIKRYAIDVEAIREGRRDP